VLDTQEPHSVDEVYYVIEGSGFIRLNGKDHEISILFLQKLTTGSMGINNTL